MIERLRGACRASCVGITGMVLVAACAGGPGEIEVSNGDRDGADLADGDVTADSGGADDLEDGRQAAGGDGADDLEDGRQAAGGGGADDLEDGDGADDLEDGEVATESDGAVGDDDFGEPTPEDITEEAPAEVEIDPTTIEVATLPIGGTADDAGENLQCVDVGWSDPPEIPASVTVVIQGLVLEPPGHFALSDRPCPGDAPPCLPDHVVTPEQRCVVAVEWTEAADDGGSLRASGTIVCDAEASVCSAFADAVTEDGGDSIPLLEPRTGATPPGNGEDDAEEDGEGDAEEDGEGDAEENGEG